MINVQIAETIINYITFLIAYVCSVTITGCFTAWLVHKMGDDTPMENGFYSLNPLIHVDFLGTLFLILYKFGWSRFIPINPFNINPPLRMAKTVIAFLAQSIGSLLLALASLLLLIVLFGEHTFEFLQSSSPVSSYLVAVGLILISFLGVNMMLAVVTFLVNMCGMVVMLVLEKRPEYLYYSGLIMVIVPIALFYLVGPSLFIFIAGIIHICAYWIAKLLYIV